MKTLTKEEILVKMCEEMPYALNDYYKAYILEAMQLFSDQETSRLTAINAKQAEYIAYLKRAIHSESIIDNITAGARDKFDAELSSLRAAGREADNCIHFDSCQGRDKCLTDKVKSVTCIGVDCGHYDDKK